ncbi:hypothetical protein [Kineococcus sp. SYSU DK001]|uniref:hypothetical protein n=1 Tax=Kineococcus sp. SYSU DK001 TaxID=3383122 RepID=UPI003D7D8C8D
MPQPTLATLDDVEAAFRPLAVDERGPAGHVLRLAHGLVRAESPGLDARVAVGDVDAQLVRDVVVAATVRALRNPEGARSTSRTAGPFTEYVQRDAGAVGLVLLEVERRLLAPRRTRPAGLGSVRLRVGL